MQVCFRVFNMCMYWFLILSVICTAFFQCHRNCVCAFVTIKKDYFLAYSLMHFSYTALLKFFVQGNQHSTFC